MLLLDLQPSRSAIETHAFAQITRRGVNGLIHPDQNPYLQRLEGRAPVYERNTISIRSGDTESEAVPTQ